MTVEQKGAYNAKVIKAVEWMPHRVALRDLVPWEHNPKSISKAHAKRLLAYWDKIGQFQTIAAGPNGEIYDGTQRYNVLKAAHGEDYEVDVRQASRALTDDERRELIVAAHVGTTGNWDWDELSGWDAAQLQEWGMDGETLKSWKSDAGALNTMLEAAKPHADAEPQIDRAAELLEKWQVKTGDLWRIGEHRLLCGDSTNTDAGDAQMVWSDPPYGLGGYAGRSGKLSPIEGDDYSPEKIVEFFGVGIAPEIYICCEWKSYPYLLAARKEPRSLIVWAKQVFGMGNGYRRQHEFIGYYGRFDSTTESDLWQIDRGAGYVHPTEKPPELPGRAISNSTNIGDVVFDPFAGTGPSLIACQNLSRKCRAIEISPAYCAVTLERMATAFPGIEIERITD